MQHSGGIRLEPFGQPPPDRLKSSGDAIGASLAEPVIFVLRVWPLLQIPIEGNCVSHSFFIYSGRGFSLGVVRSRRFDAKWTHRRALRYQSSGLVYDRRCHWLGRRPAYGIPTAGVVSLTHPVRIDRVRTSRAAIVQEVRWYLMARLNRANPLSLGCFGTPGNRQQTHQPVRKPNPHNPVLIQEHMTLVDRPVAARTITRALSVPAR